MVSRQVVLTGSGILIGTAASFGVTQVLRSQLYGIGLVDLPTLAGVTVVLATAAILACIVPAVKASRADPLETLKVE